MGMDLKGEVALVTGSARGLGRAMAQRLAELGAAVAIHDITPDACAEFGEAKDINDVAARIAANTGAKTVSICGNIADEAQVAAMVEKVEATLGPISVLVNNAGGDIALRGGKPKPNSGLGVPMEDARAIFERNIIGTMIVCRAVCPGMAKRARGSVVNIASGAAHFGVDDGVAYAVAKAGIVEWTQCLAVELRQAGVRVNAVSPGPTKTARFLLTRTIDPKQADESVPLDRYGTPEEVADVVAFLASPAARFVSGQTLLVDGARFTRLYL
ncbi:MAG: short-chain dehydrogenase/reductase [Phycisphaerales bacterium]|nr:short-chain dehydrogenase/reductase [Phycisphaerales bacterium]